MVARISTSFLRPNNIRCMGALHLIHSSPDGHLCRFHLLATETNAAMNRRVQVFVWTLENPTLISIVIMAGNDPEAGSPGTVSWRHITPALSLIMRKHGTHQTEELATTSLGRALQMRQGCERAGRPEKLFQTGEGGE